MVQQDTVQPLKGRWRLLASAQAILVSQADLQVEQALGTHRRGWLPRDILPKLFKALTACADVRLDDMPIKWWPHP